MKIDRILAIIMTLINVEKTTAEELARKFEVSVRTIYRDIDSINQAGIPIISQSGPGNGIGILDTYKIEKQLFSTNDISTLLMALGNLQVNINKQGITHTIAKIKGLVPSEKKEELNFRANQIRVDFAPWISSDYTTQRINVIKTAMEKQVLIRFTYCDNLNNVTNRDVEPHSLLLKGENWYLQGFCRSREDFRTFNIFKMDEISLLDQEFIPKNLPSAKSPSFHDTSMTMVTLRIHKSAKAKIISRFGDTCLTAEDEEYFIAKISVPISDLFFSFLYGFGCDCECLEPEEVRNQMTVYSERLYDMYHKNK